MFKKGLLLGMLLASPLISAEPSGVYLLGEFTYKGTPISKAVLLQDRRVNDLQQCRDFVRYHIRGTERGKNYYRHYIRTQRTGVNIVPRYTCIKTRLTISQWHDHDFYDKVYLFDLRKGQRFTQFEDTNSCWAGIRNDPDKHSGKLFCAKMSQSISPAR